MASKHLFCSLAAALALVLALSSSLGSARVVINRNVPNTWCVANPAANPANLQHDIDSLCSSNDCSSIRPGGACYQPNDIVSHASVIFNLYYKAHASQASACNFGGDAMFSLSNPSSGTCVYP